MDKLPLWSTLLGLVAFNVAAVAAVISLLRNAGDGSEPVTLLKMQAGAAQGGAQRMVARPPTTLGGFRGD